MNDFNDGQLRVIGEVFTQLNFKIGQVKTMIVAEEIVKKIQIHFKDKQMNKSKMEDDKNV